MSKEQFEELYVDYLVGDLPPAEAEEFSRHAEACPECRRELREVESALHALALSAPQHDPPAALKARILQSARSDVATSGPLPLRSPRRRWVTAWAVAASLLAALGLAGSIVFYLRGVEQSQRLTALEEEVDRLQQANQTLDIKLRQITAPSTRFMTMAGLEDYSQIEGRAFVDPESGRTRLFLNRLPVLPQDQVFQLWFLEPGAAPHPSVVFSPEAPRTEVDARLTIPADQLAGLAVSIEPPGGSSSPTGPIVATGQL